MVKGFWVKNIYQIYKNMAVYQIFRW